MTDEIALSERTYGMIGRKEEIERLHTCLLARGERHFIYYWAHGGLGKTRLLEELLRLINKAGPGYHSSSIIDLYHTDTHSTSDVERAIVEGLDPERKYFARYRQERQHYERLRERGSSPGVLEQYRVKLSQTFVQDCRDMALDARKLVICFDTVELLQYESSLVEEKAGLDAADTRLKPWLLQNLAQLANVLVVFAGRPKKQEGDTIDHHTRLVEDMRIAFGQDFVAVELQPFNLAETQDFINILSGGAEVIPARYLPVVHLLTEGRPIFLHLIVDLIQVLSPEPRKVLEIFDQYTDLVDTPEDSKRLREARHRIEVEILRGIINSETAELGAYLSRLALMPKGFDEDVLGEVLGLPRAEAKQLLSNLEPLSFIKHPKILRLDESGDDKGKLGSGRLKLHSERIFLHDEMYQLLTLPEVMPNLRMNERQVAKSLVANYYDPQIAHLEREINRSEALEERVKLRERRQKLQVERLYYLLVHDPCAGYAEYKRLNDEANRHRWVGFSMRLLDEFLRLYNDTVRERRKLFETACIAHEQVIRESAQMWIERFYWWGQYDRVIEFGDYILENPDIFSIHPQENAAVLATICARWVDARAMRNGYEANIVARAEAILDYLPLLAESNSEEAVARARLAAAIGYQYRLGGMPNRAADRYVEAKAAFEKEPAYQDEHATLLHSLAFVYALQGRILLARPLAFDALRINQKMGSEYSTGLTLTTLASIAGKRGSYYQAIRYAEEAIALFEGLGDAHGIALAYWSIVSARRHLAMNELRKDWKLEEVLQNLQEIDADFQEVLDATEKAKLAYDILLLRAEKGRLYRDLGEATSLLQGSDKGLAYYRQAEKLLKHALGAPGWNPIGKADTLQDLAETLFLSGDPVGARECLEQVETQIGPEYLIRPGQPLPAAGLARQYFTPLGKVEMTRGQMAFNEGQFETGLQHYALAYAYFMRFSDEAIEMDTMVEYLYDHLREAPDKQGVVESVRRWANEAGLTAEVDPLMQILEDLLGV